MPSTQQHLQIIPNRRFLQYADGTPFFYLGDTAWELCHRLTVAEADRYLTNRAAKGFTVIQAVALAELDGLTTASSKDIFLVERILFLAFVVLILGSTIFSFCNHERPQQRW